MQLRSKFISPWCIIALTMRNVHFLSWNPDVQQQVTQPWLLWTHWLHLGYTSSFATVVMFLPNPGHCVCLLTNRRYFLRTVLVFISMFAGLSQTCQNKECIINFRIKALDFLILHPYNEEVMSRFLTSYVLFWRHSLNMPRTGTKAVIN